MKRVSMKEIGWKIILAIIAVLAPIHAVLLTVGLLIAADTVTGIWAAVKKGDKITSAKLRNTVSKSFVYTIMIIVSHFMEVHIMSDVIPVAKIVATLISSVELLSLAENSNIILGQNIFSALIEKLGSTNVANPKPLILPNPSPSATPAVADEPKKEEPKVG